MQDGWRRWSHYLFLLFSQLCKNTELPFIHVYSWDKGKVTPPPSDSTLSCWLMLWLSKGCCVFDLKWQIIVQTNVTATHPWDFSWFRTDNYLEIPYMVIWMHLPHWNKKSRRCVFLYVRKNKFGLFKHTTVKLKNVIFQIGNKKVL